MQSCVVFTVAWPYRHSCPAGYSRVESDKGGDYEMAIHCFIRQYSQMLTVRKKYKLKEHKRQLTVNITFMIIVLFRLNIKLVDTEYL